MSIIGGNISSAPTVSNVSTATVDLVGSGSQNDDLLDEDVFAYMNTLVPSTTVTASTTVQILQRALDNIEQEVSNVVTST